MNILIYLLILIAVCGIWELTVRFGLKSLSCSRSFSRDCLFEGEECELIETVRNDKPFIIPWLRLESKISPYLRLGNQDNLNISGEMYYCSLFTLFPYQQIRRRHRVRFLRRGAYDLGNASLTVGDILGLHQKQRNQNLSAPILVFPRLLEQEELPAPISRMTGELPYRRQLLQDPFLVRGIRPYQPGDPIRDIHWPATARTGETQVRIHDYTAQTRLLVVLNVQQEDLQWQDLLPEDQEQAVEYSISLAATICIRALRSGVAAGFAANMPSSDLRGESTLVLPGVGTVQEDLLLSSFARLKIRRTLEFSVFLESLTKHSGLDILVLSPYDNDCIQQKLHALRQCGNQVTFFQFEGGSQ